MKKILFSIVAVLAILGTMLPYVGLAAYGLTKSLDFENTSSQYATVADSTSLSVSGDFTAEAWVNLESEASDRWIVGKCDGSTTCNWFMSLGVFSANPVLRGTIYTNANRTAGYISTCSTALSFDTWTHVAMVWQPSTVIKLYINGVECSSYVSQQTVGGGGATISDSNVQTKVGGEQNFFGYYFDGELSLIRIWKEARTATQLADNDCEVLGSTTNLSAEWTLDNVYTDNSGNANTLTQTNNPTFVTNTPSVCATVAAPPRLQSPINFF